MSFGFGVGDFIAVLDKAKLYRERFADAPDHFDSLGREIASLTSILEYIGRVEDQLTENEKEALAAPIKESTKLLGELENIYNDNTSLEKHEGTSTLSKLKPRAVWRRLRMKPEDVQKLRQRITMNVHFLSAIKGFRDSEAIHTTKQVVTSIQDEQTSRQEREILDWLTATDYAPQQRDNLSRRYTGTNQWLLDSDEYKSWVSGRSQILLCPGMPGAGKTIMASVVVDDLFHRYQDDSDVGIAYVYCNFKDQESQNHYDMLSSITKQLAQRRSPIPDMQSFVQRRPEIQDEIQKGILCKINGMFLLAKLLIDSLSCKTTLKAVRKALDAASAGDDTYAYFYEEALERIRVQPTAHVQLASQVLSWIVFAKRPLEIRELQHALAVEEEELDIEEDNIPSAEIMISACSANN
ncbi:Vegetative incompatibility protein HET-E-1 [Colletotrichum sp. SAR 10_65]|nr:Vegetative incompatibility protein HET-E-1 [Colletotrichum sp. SAR 10_65]KAI8245548.1 Vegetative incompatibility protein HET-E-1 [Colletotrichum sp. SAR 10_77]KAJ5005777.1 Vegetative incompatibility protein HET-E-1 [Colletotrichum sp. SAR 10_66]